MEGQGQPAAYRRPVNLEVTTATPVNTSGYKKRRRGDWWVGGGGTWQGGGRGAVGGLR